MDFYLSALALFAPQENPLVLQPVRPHEFQ